MKQGRFHSLSLLPAADLRSAETDNRTALGLKWRMGIDPGKGRLRFEAGRPARLSIAPGSPAPDWIELRWVSRSAELCGFGQIILQIALSAALPCPVHPALRLRLGEGFRDVFAPAIEASPDRTEAERCFTLPPDRDGAVRSIDLHLFFDPVETTIAVHHLSLTALRP